jgi:hypothetical protein
MTWYVGLTDVPERRRKEHGNPPDWQQTATEFTTEETARAWEAQYVNKPGYQGGTGGSGWRFGYWYTITSSTRE